MRATTPLRLLPLLVPLLLLGCDRPPPSPTCAVRRPARSQARRAGLDRQELGGRGLHAAGREPQSADVFCGTWQQPSARVRSGGPGTAAQLAELVATSPWRSGIDNRFRCEPPVATTILGGNPAELMQCTRLVGGWAHVAMVALVNNTIWYADGVLPAAQVMERSIGVLAGVTRADAVAPTSGADALLASRLAAKAFSSGDVGQFDTLMAAGTRANLADNPGAAESAFRAALALQQKALGKDNPNTSTALMSLALQLSNEGRYAEADALFADAGKLAPGSADATAQARLLHYRGLDAMNQGQLEQALTLLTPGRCRLCRRWCRPMRWRRGRGPCSRPTLSPAPDRSAWRDLMPSQDLLTDPRAQAALLGLIEVRRNRAVVLRIMGQTRGGRCAAEVGSRSRARQRAVAARSSTRGCIRTSGRDGGGTGTGRSGAGRPAAIDHGVRPVAARLEAAGRHLPAARPPTGEGRQGRCRAADLPQRGAVAGGTEGRHHAGADGVLPRRLCRRGGRGRRDQRQALLAEMFTAAQLAQGGITSQQIAQATARLSENCARSQGRRGDPPPAGRVGQAVRPLSPARRTGRGAAPGRSAATNAASADLDKQISDAQTALADADAALAGGLAELRAARAAGGAGEGRVRRAASRTRRSSPSRSATRTAGCSCCATARITVSRIDGGLEQVAELVRRVRAGIELTIERPADVRHRRCAEAVPD